MKQSLFKLLFLLFSLLSFSVSAQYAESYTDLKLFLPLPTSIEKIKAVQHSIYKGDTISENFFEYHFDRRRNFIDWEYFTYHVGEEIKYDSADRIVEIDGLYGESFENGIIKYYYPSKNQKIEIHEKMGYYKYIKSDFIFDGNDRIVGEIKYDSTFNLMDSTLLVDTKNISYSYDKYGNKVGEIHFINSGKDFGYEMHALYHEKKILNKTERYFENNSTQKLLEEEFFYITEGNFKDKISKRISSISTKNDTTKNEVRFSYKKVDTLSNIQEQKYFTDYSDDKEYLQNTVEERKYFRNGKLTQINKYFYRYNHLIALEEYHISEEKKSDPKLSNWTEYSYFFYPKTKK
ncbi:hypothetical protein ACE193_24430 [Bernardetia sp. OM2101]|uniref:hypothetical protein n=1 Tax=Bernardetia sp. OM2101 TaxID=3344876 RepID=UPI0035CF0EBC